MRKKEPSLTALDRAQRPAYKNYRMSSENKENELGYDAWSALYDTYPNPTVAIDELYFPQVYAEVRQQNVLEVGCGTGRHTTRLLALHNTVTGIDISPGMLAKLRDKIKSPQLTLIRGDFLTAPIRTAPFDSVVMSLVLEHIFDLSLFFARAGEILRPGGRIYISEIHPARTANGVFAHFKNTDGSEVHLKSAAHNSAAIEEAARQNGFCVATALTINGNDQLVALNRKWAKHLGQPMIQIWVLLFA